MSLPSLLKREAAIRRECERLSGELARKVAELRLIERDILAVQSVVERQQDRRTIMGFLKRAWGRSEEPLALPAPPTDEEE